MTKQELFKQADYTFQRGNRELAKKYLTEYLAAFPNDEAGWMLMARILEKQEEIIQCYERVLALNPNHNEAKIGLARIQAKQTPTLTNLKPAHTTIWQAPPSKNKLRVGLLVLAVFALFATTSLVIARNNPASQMAQVLAFSTPEAFGNPDLQGNIAPKFRSQIEQTQPEYTALVNSLLGVAVDHANDGMEGAPERPGAEIMVSEKAGTEVRSIFNSSVFQPGTLNSISITEQQATSWLAMNLSQHPDLPLSDPQVYLRNGKVQIWGMINGAEASTSVLIVGKTDIDSNKQPYVVIESMQIGTQVVPDVFLSSIADWLNQSLQESISKHTPGLEIMNINVTSGMITIAGMR